MSMSDEQVYNTIYEEPDPPKVDKESVHEIIATDGKEG